MPLKLLVMDMWRAGTGYNYVGNSIIHARTVLMQWIKVAIIIQHYWQNIGSMWQNKVCPQHLPTILPPLILGHAPLATSSPL